MQIEGVLTSRQTTLPHTNAANADRRCTRTIDDIVRPFNTMAGYRFLTRRGIVLEWNSNSCETDMECWWNSRSVNRLVVFCSMAWSVLYVAPLCYVVACWGAKRGLRVLNIVRVAQSVPMMCRMCRVAATYEGQKSTTKVSKKHQRNDIM